jgi:fructoselysine 6-kinase
MKLIAIGDNVVDYYKDREEIFPGGNAVNVAVFSKWYGADQSSYIGIVADDEGGRLVAKSLNKEQIDISRMRYAIGQNEESIVALNEEGDRIFVGSVHGVQSQLKLLLDNEDLAFIQQHDVVHTSIYSHLESELPKLQAIRSISYDFSTNRDEKLLKEVCPFLTYAFFSGGGFSREECIAFIRKIHQFGVKVVGITRGSLGAIFSDQKDVYEQPIVENKQIVDTLGAGDSFIAMFLMRYLAQGDMKSSLAAASDAASQTCSRFGAYGYGKPRA